ncbi:MmgE/PrpD family protein [Rathayibacter sp. Leaf248]|uniref:MmgE/PrpD family protein n=1 Tax=Rathayibacter sp. Leaf248 TaxID=2876555 RepID=UPI001E33E614|nr:MmgE/PrpD family protein [Rathayibacter sp. Leaf248]
MTPALEGDLAQHFAHLAAHVDPATLPEEASEAAKKSILDTLGVSLAASGLEPAARSVLSLVREGSSSEATVLGYGGRASAADAAFVNGALAHALDFDDQTPWGQHAASSIVPAALALAERVGGVSGGTLIAAVAVGQDLFARLRRHVGWRKDWNLSSVLGVYAGTVAAGRVLGLPADRIESALGIASMHSSGVMNMVAGTGSDLRGMYAAFSARGAVTSALLAERGLSGVPELFEGETGVLATYFHGEYDRHAILHDLGSDFRGAGTLYKLWPSVGTSHSHIHATLKLMEELGIAADDIESLRVHVGDYHAVMCRPLADRRTPASGADAKFSLPFLVALAAVRGGVGLHDFTPAGLDDAAVLALAQRVQPIPNAGLDWTDVLPPGRVEIRTRDGRTATRVGTGVPGNGGNPLTWDQLTAKFVECAGAAAAPLDPMRVSRAAGLIRRLETVSDVREVVDLLAD